MKLDLGNLLFPNMPPDLRRRRMGVIYVTAIVTIVLGLALYKIIAVLNHPGKH